MAVPMSSAAAVFAAVVELIGGAALLLGAATALAGALVVLNMLGAFLLVHIGNGVFVTDNGFELVAVIAAAAPAAGRRRSWSVQHRPIPRRPTECSRPRVTDTSRRISVVPAAPVSGRPRRPVGRFHPPTAGPATTSGPLSLPFWSFTHPSPIRFPAENVLWTGGPWATAWAVHQQVGGGRGQRNRPEVIRAWPRRGRRGLGDRRCSGPIASCRSARRSGGPPESTPTVAPVNIRASPTSTAAVTSAVTPRRPNRNGRTGTAAPVAKNAKLESAAPSPVPTISCRSLSGDPESPSGRGRCCAARSRRDGGLRQRERRGPGKPARVRWP